ncbi:MAG: hypothetical protein JSR71_02485, partial [Proteobacteria bacterium]|nr:hypothetical protein [Pseudomonadota bacterium]
FGVRISTLELMRSPNLAHMAHMLMEKTILSISSPVSEAIVQESSVIDHISEKDIDLLLQQLQAEVSDMTVGISKGIADV